ncbi:GCR1 [Acanthosepion pharaonis]|uniref:GCR1 n=1 Tax=Acanthosepion pharaonis TaxID=158019 RepID=A0A812CG65_ACAPH|nr:GCR1 [Sepia pharaonis]
MLAPLPHQTAKNSCLVHCTDHIPGGLHPDGPLCNFQGFWLTYFDWAVLLWVSCITFNLYMNVVRAIETDRFECQSLTLYLSLFDLACLFPLWFHLTLFLFCAPPCVSVSISTAFPPMSVCLLCSHVSVSLYYCSLSCLLWLHQLISLSLSCISISPTYFFSSPCCICISPTTPSLSGPCISLLTSFLLLVWSICISPNPISLSLWCIHICPIPLSLSYVYPLPSFLSLIHMYLPYYLLSFWSVYFSYHHLSPQLIWNSPNTISLSLSPSYTSPLFLFLSHAYISPTSFSLSYSYVSLPTTFSFFLVCVYFPYLHLSPHAICNSSTYILCVVYHLVCCLFPLLMSSLPFIGDHYGPAGAWCWIIEDWKWRVGIWYGPLFGIIALLFVTYIYIVVTLSKKVSTWEGTYDPDTERNKQMLKEDIKPLRGYPFVYLAVSIFPLIYRIQNAVSTGNPVFTLVLLASISSPLHGALNAIVFGMDRNIFEQLTPTRIKHDISFSSKD